MTTTTLSWEERLHYRDRLRAARYSALADAEGFGEICFAIEALGMRLKGRESAMGRYREAIQVIADDSVVLSTLAREFPTFLTRFEALFETVRCARNDVMHTGVYARHATTAAVELSIGLEEGLMKPQQLERKSVSDYMVKSPTILESWHPLAYARQLMLTHSFSYLPVKLNGWKLVSEIAMARYLYQNDGRATVMAASIEDAAADGLGLLDARVVQSTANVEDLLNEDINVDAPMLWLVADGRDGICGVLSPFELM